MSKFKGRLCNEVESMKFAALSSLRQVLASVCLYADLSHGQLVGKVFVVVIVVVVCSFFGCCCWFDSTTDRGGGEVR